MQCQCILCSGNSEVIDQINSDQLKKNWESIHDISYILKESYYDVFKCSECGLVYFDKRLIGDSVFYDGLNSIAGYYDDTFKSEYKFASNYLTDNDKVLDVGCGFGVFSNYLVNKNNFTGLDLSDRSFNYGKSNNIDIRKELIEEHSLANIEKYDVVTCFQVLEHINNPNEFIFNMLKVLKKDGKLIIAVPNNDSYLKYIPNNTFNLPPHHPILWTNKQLIKIATIFNLEIKKVYKESISHTHKKEAQFAFYYFVISFIKKNKIKYINFSDKHFKIYNLSFRLINTIPGLLTSFLMKILNFRKGHTIVFVFQKK